jgi:hypothetical protein
MRYRKLKLNLLWIAWVLCFSACQQPSNEDSQKIQEAVDKIKVKIQNELSKGTSEISKGTHH